MINSTPVAQAAPSYQPCLPQHANQQNQKNHTQRHVQLDPILMTYTEFLPTLICKNLVQTRTQPAVWKQLSWWYKVDQHFAFHQRAPSHDI